MIVRVRRGLTRARGRLGWSAVVAIVQSAVTAGAAWEIALQIPGHGQPFFAPIAAVVALGAERGRRGRQALELIAGVGLGILIGAGITRVFGAGAWQLVVATTVVLVVATAAGTPRVVRVQAAASAILVVALHRPGSNLALQRLVDALIGGGLALLVARFLFPVDPLELVRGEARALRERLAAALTAVADALANHDSEAAREAVDAIDGIDDRALDESLALAREVARNAPRRRPVQRRLDALGIAWRELELALADARAIATGAQRALASDGEVSPQLAEAVRAAADAVRSIDPAEARAGAERARHAAELVSQGDSPLGALVLAHGVASVAEHALRAADAREADRRVVEELRRQRFHLPRRPPA